MASDMEFVVSIRLHFTFKEMPRAVIEAGTSSMVYQWMAFGLLLLD